MTGWCAAPLAPPFGGAGTALAVTERALSAPHRGHLSHRERQGAFGADTPTNSYFSRCYVKIVRILFYSFRSRMMPYRACFMGEVSGSSAEGSPLQSQR